MSEDNATGDGVEIGKNGSGGSHPSSGLDGPDRVSISRSGGDRPGGADPDHIVVVAKDVLPDGAERTIVTQKPARGLKRPGQIKEEYEGGYIDLEKLRDNVLGGLGAMKPVITRTTYGEGKDKRVQEEITWIEDWTERRAWQDHVVHTVEGQPIKRQEIVTRKLTTQEDLIAQAQKSPALARSLMEVLQRVIVEQAAGAEKGGAETSALKADK